MNARNPRGKEPLFPCHRTYFKALSFSGQTPTPDFWSSSRVCSAVSDSCQGRVCCRKLRSPSTAEQSSFTKTGLFQSFFISCLLLPAPKIRSIQLPIQAVRLKIMSFQNYVKKSSKLSPIISMDSLPTTYWVIQVRDSWTSEILLDKGLRTVHCQGILIQISSQAVFRRNVSIFS